ncbi:MAG: NADH-quinone oxidoreductase subunit A [Flammeovirgaceae bacterium]
MLSDFAYLLLFLIGGLIFASIGLFAASMIRPKRPNPEKLTSYECGEDPTGSAWGNFNIRFYIVALIFILFDVEIVFLFPWATVFGQQELIENTSGLWGWFSLAEMFIFLCILALGLAYAWRKGFLDWVRPQVKVEDYQSPVPPQLYEKINQQYQTADQELVN